ncbi:CDP-alcohol phosphatidyltransferase family protein [Prochlorococcus sp. MIT 1223]|uniref:CDP-alcohol phosphatidyltransferase family protein n=1 Tax=Prochlorococcus sp. MIT 1223 TaxID=3096217 RepID=UPI002A764A64|nr:CDP-alcohol phosphatidyltransferase family protein [Prochlorococcus sp. MIT 1223]
MKENNLLLRNRKYRALANFLTIFRCLIGLPIIILLTYNKLLLAWALILIGGLTDILDGKIARLSGTVSSFGSKLDPLADKLLLLAPIIWLCKINLLPLWSVWILLTREIVVSTWRSDIPSGGPASVGAKVKTFLQFFSIILLLWPAELGGIYIKLKLNLIGWYIFWPSLLLALTSALGYIRSQSISHQK